MIILSGIIVMFVGIVGLVAQLQPLFGLDIHTASAAIKPLDLGACILFIIIGFAFVMPRE